VIRQHRATAGVPPGLKESRGRSFPLGPTVSAEGVNFSIFSRGSTAVHLLLFDGVNDEAPSRVITLHPRGHRTYHYWHAFVPDIRPGQVYAYRVEGPRDPARGLRFDADKILLDPYGKCVGAPGLRSRDAAVEARSYVVQPRTTLLLCAASAQHP
jgi:isoamylase